MVAIQTKYLGATNFKGARVKAWREHGPSLTLSWDHALNVEENHKVAAQAFAEKMGWEGRWVGGGLEHGWAFVNVDARYEIGFTVKAKKVQP
jgi:hypothetical protein